MKVANNVVTINKLLILYWITLCLCKCIGSDAAVTGAESPKTHHNLFEKLRSLGLVHHDKSKVDDVNSEFTSESESESESVSLDKIAETAESLEQFKGEVSDEKEKGMVDKFKNFIVGIFDNDQFDLFNIELRDPSKYADDALITKVGNANKVSFTLRLIHSIAEYVIFESARRKLKAGATDDATRFEGLSDDDVIDTACLAHNTKMCRWVVKEAKGMEPGQRTAIAVSLKELPETGKPWQLLYLRFFDYGINILEASHLDMLINLDINVAAGLNPVTAVVASVSDLLIKLKIILDQMRVDSKEATDKEKILLSGINPIE